MDVIAEVRSPFPQHANWLWIRYCSIFRAFMLMRAKYPIGLHHAGSDKIPHGRMIGKRERCGCDYLTTSTYAIQVLRLRLCCLHAQRELRRYTLCETVLRPWPGPAGGVLCSITVVGRRVGW